MEDSFEDVGLDVEGRVDLCEVKDEDGRDRLVAAVMAAFSCLDA